MNPWGPDGKPKSAGFTSRPDPRTEAAHFRYKPPGETVRLFMKSNAFVRGLRGPIGSGKSTACCAEIMRRATLQTPAPDGIRKTRWAIIRNTSPELRTTTMKTWAQIIPERQWGNIRWSAPYTHHIRKGDVDCEVIFLGLDKPDDIKKLLSLELTGAWINEAREVPKAIVDGVTSRVGRFPPPFEGGPTWWGVWMDTNAPDVDHWWPILAGEAPMPDYLSYEESLMMQKPEGWEFFTQPPAMFERKDATGMLEGYTLNPDGENVTNLPPGYYDKLIAGKTRSWISIYVRNELGHEQRGKPVYKGFNEEFHVSRETLEPDPAFPFTVGVDFGLSPAAIVGQQDADGRWRMLREIIGVDMGAEKFCTILAKELARMVPKKDWRQRVKVYGDPSGNGRSDADENTAFRVFRANGIMVIPAPTNDLTPRVETVERLLGKVVNGRPGMLFCKTGCKMLIRALAGGYRYRQLQVSGVEARFEETPEKNRFSHPADAHQYLVLGAGEGRETLRTPTAPANSQGRTARKAGIMERRSLRDRLTTRRERTGRL